MVVVTPTAPNVPQLVPGIPTRSADCGPAGGARIVRFVTYQAVEPDAYDVRRFVRTKSGAPDTGPTNVNQIAAALMRGFGVYVRVESPDPFETMWQLIQSPYVIATVYVSYYVFRGTPFYASRTGFVGAHTITVSNADADDALMGDSLRDGVGGVPSGTARVPKALLRKACGEVVVQRQSGRERLGYGLVIAGYATAPVIAEPEPEVQPDPMDNLFPDTYLAYGLDLPVGTRFYEDPALTVEQGRVREPDPGRTTKTFALISSPIGAGLVWKVANGDRGVFVKRGANGPQPRRLPELARVGA